MWADRTHRRKEGDRTPTEPEEFVPGTTDDTSEANDDEAEFVVSRWSAVTHPILQFEHVTRDPP